MRPTAVLSLDMEDWYHLDYFSGKERSDYTMLDGIDVYRNLLDKFNIPSSYFVLGELMEPLSAVLCELSKEGADIAVHGWNHARPLTMNVEEFTENISAAKTKLEKITGKPVLGYRAPCFSMDRKRLDAIMKLGFKYDSSRIDFSSHPLYGSLDMEGFESPASFIYKKDDFFEFEVGTLSFFSRQIPVSGGGYLRIFPWRLMRYLIKKYISKFNVYTLYIHPFELSRKPPPYPDSSISALTRFRFQHGLGTVENKLKSLIDFLTGEGFSFTTFTSLRKDLL
ncbi:MAG: polysaccharide deacetylase family protein [Desulfobacteraceae bacterium]|nr:polysaccharide deacetylase family protein [Desulfobacteraceae bacterium]